MEKKLKLWEGAALVALCATLLSAAWAQGEQTRLSGELIRLHVIAASDDEEEQAVKLRVRDAVLASLGPMMDGITGADEARAALLENLGAIAGAAASEAGGRQVTVTLGQETYPARGFEGGMLPAGRYESLRVILGEGEGRNWWGLLFPQLCLPAVQRDGETDQLRETLRRDGILVAEESERVELRFQLLEWWGELRNLLEKKPVA